MHDYSFNLQLQSAQKAASVREGDLEGVYLTIKIFCPKMNFHQLFPFIATMEKMYFQSFVMVWFCLL